MRSGFAPLLGIVLLAGIGALAWGTEGFRVVTSDGARRLQIEERPAPVPQARLIDQDGAAFSLRDYRGKTLLVEFIYTRCPWLCSVLGDEFQRLSTLARAGSFGSEVDLLSISFDPQHDDRPALALYGERYGAIAPRWRVAVPADRRSLASLLRSFGVVVIPDGMGGFIHDGAVYLVNPSGRLARVLDAEASPQQVSEVLRSASR